MSDYKDFFTRGYQNNSDWDNPIGRPKMEDIKTGRLGQLHHDVFNHHHRPECVPEYISNLQIQQHDASRIISLDNLTDYYINSDLPVEVSLIENQHKDDLSEDEADSYRVSFEDFYRAATDIPFAEKAPESERLGGNRVTYLFGKVGTGKSFLCARVIAKLLRQETDVHGYRVVPIRICFETLSRNKTIDMSRIDETFLQYLLATIEGVASNLHPGDVTLTPVVEPLSETQLFHLIHNSALRLAKRRIRVVVIFDNIDGFHYRYSRFLFFKEMYDDFTKKVQQTLVKLCNIVSDESLLGNAGLCVVVVAREAVARDFMYNQSDPDRAIIDGHRAFWLEEADPKKIIESRYRLLDHATRAIVSQGFTLAGAKGQDYTDALEVARAKILDSASTSGAGLGVIWGLCHHGHRSLVEFISQIKINYYSQRDVHDRLFGSNPHVLERLYITNMRRRYAQCKNHFPNLFLCDAWINPDNVEKGVTCEHRHTYWLKYMILKYVLLRDESGRRARASEVVQYFVGNGYEEMLVRLSLGSLCMANESRCLELGGPPQARPDERELKLSTRGRLLVANGGSSGRKLPYCFDISYLQLMADDFWLALPRFCSEEIFVDANLAHTFYSDDRYPPGVAKYMSKKIFAALTLLRVLEASWAYEEKKSRERTGTLSSLKPDFDEIFRETLSVILGIISKGFNGVIRDGSNSIVEGDVRRFLTVLRRNDAYETFFDSVWREEVKICGSMLD